QARTRANDPAALAAGSAAFDVKVDPGNAALERGAPLLVVARFGGAVPADASLVVDDGRGSDARRPMTRSLEDPTFAGRVESVNADLAYRVEFQGRSSPTYRIKVFEYPELRRADAKLVFPGYTALKPKTVEDVRHVTAIEGTELTLLCRLNKDVKAARLVDEKGNAIPLAPQGGGNHAYAATLTLSDSRRYRVGLVDNEGRVNKLTAEALVTAPGRRPPVSPMSQPARDVRVSPVEELALKAEVADDFGVVRHGLSYAMAGREPREVLLKGPEPPGRRVKAE